MISNLLTIIIPCKNEENYIPNLLNSLNNQKGIYDTKIIISDAKSTDKTLEIINSFKDKLNIEVIDGGLPGIARNNGSKISKTKYLLFIDADAEIYDVELIYESMIKIINNDYDLLASKLNSNNFKVKILYKLNNLISFISKYDKPFCTGMFFLIKSDVFTNLGGFPENAMHCEDYLLSKKVNSKKFGIINKDVYSDDRRFKKMGYFGMFKYVLRNIINRNNDDYFKKNINYW